MTYLYVLEGPDLAGKTTLADDLENRITDGSIRSVRRRAFSKPDEDDTSTTLFGKYMNELTLAQKSFESKGAVTIIDRLHIGELIYGSYFRVKPLLSYEMAVVLDQMLDELGAAKLFVDAPDKVLLSRLFKRGDDVVDAQSIVHIAHNYRDALMPLEDIGARSFDGWQHILPGTKVAV